MTYISWSIDFALYHCHRDILAPQGICSSNIISWQDILSILCSNQNNYLPYSCNCMRAVQKDCRLLLSNASWYMHCLTIYISIIRFLHSTHLRICLNDITYLSTRAVYITMVTRDRCSYNLSGSSLKIGIYTTNKKWKNALLNRFNC